MRLRPLRRIAATVLLVLLGATIALFLETYFRSTPQTAGPVRFSVPSPEKATFLQGITSPWVSLSPDGRNLAFLAVSDGISRVWVRSLDSVEARPLMTTDGVGPDAPFWSPDSRFIGFFAQGKLKKIEVAGGPAQTLCDFGGGNALGGTWNRDGVILFAQGGVRGGALMRVAASGGKPELLLTIPDRSPGERNSFPYFLPDGEHFLFLARNSTGDGDNAIFAGALHSKEVKFVINASSRLAYDRSGYLLFVRERSLMAVPFDADKLQVRGDPFPIAQNVAYAAGNFSASLTVSDNGVLAYRTGGITGNRSLTWFDRTGKTVGASGGIAYYRNPKLSPDEKRIAVSRIDPPIGVEDIWVVESTRGVSTRITFAGGQFQIWSPNGEQIAFLSNRNQTSGLFTKLSSGAGTEQPLMNLSELAWDWSADGRFMILSLGSRAGLSVLPLFGDRKVFEYLQESKFIIEQAQLSADGRWLAYQSNESGRNEVYVQSFPAPSGKWQISTEGGISPRWRRDGKEIFYLSPDQRLMAVSVRSSTTALEISTPAPLFDVRVPSGNGYIQQYDVTGDGQRILVNTVVEESQEPITVVLNWTAGLRK